MMGRLEISSLEVLASCPGWFASQSPWAVEDGCVPARLGCWEQRWVLVQHLFTIPPFRRVFSTHCCTLGCRWALGKVPKLQVNLGPEALWSLEKADEESTEVCGYFRFLLTSALLWARFKRSANKPQAKG